MLELIQHIVGACHCCHAHLDMTELVVMGAGPLGAAAGYAKAKLGRRKAARPEDGVQEVRGTQLPG